MSRFDIGRFQPPPDDEFVCGICMNVLDQPKESPCRHVFCQVCITRALVEKSKCPICRARLKPKHLKDVLPMVQNLLNKLQMQCEFSSCGCKTLVPLEGYKSHVIVCGFQTVSCQITGCGQSILKRDQDKHERQECLHRTYVCDQGCECDVKFTDKDSHNCINTLRLKLNDAKEHIQKLEQEVQSLTSFASTMTNSPRQSADILQFNLIDDEESSSGSGYVHRTSHSQSRSLSRSRSRSRSLSRSPHSSFSIASSVVDSPFSYRNFSVSPVSSGSLGGSDEEITFNRRNNRPLSDIDDTDEDDDIDMGWLARMVRRRRSRSRSTAEDDGDGVNGNNDEEGEREQERGDGNEDVSVSVQFGSQTAPGSSGLSSPCISHNNHVQNVGERSALKRERGREQEPETEVHKRMRLSFEAYFGRRGRDSCTNMGDRRDARSDATDDGASNSGNTNTSDCNRINSVDEGGDSVSNPGNINLNDSYDARVSGDSRVDRAADDANDNGNTSNTTICNNNNASSAPVRRSARLRNVPAEPLAVPCLDLPLPMTTRDLLLLYGDDEENESTDESWSPGIP